MVSMEFGQRNISKVYHRHCWEHLWWLAWLWVVVGVVKVFFFQISNAYFLGMENVPCQPLTIFEQVAFIRHWNVRPNVNPTIIIPLSHYLNTIPLFSFQSHFSLLNPTIIFSIPLFAHQSHFFGHIFIIPLLLFSYILKTSVFSMHIGKIVFSPVEGLSGDHVEPRWSQGVAEICG